MKDLILKDISYKIKEIILCDDCNGKGGTCIKCSGSGRLSHIKEEKFLAYDEKIHSML